MDGAFVKNRFPRIYATCLQYDVDITRELVPVSPAAHYLMGGITTDTEGATSIEGLFGAGEVACTGVHGANRLASNSLLEGLVYGARAGRAAANYGLRISDSLLRNMKDLLWKKVTILIPCPRDIRTQRFDMEEIRHSLRKLMWRGGDNTLCRISRRSEKETSGVGVYSGKEVCNEAGA